MDLIEKINLLNRIEKNDLSLFEIEGINWWPMVRIYISQNKFDGTSLQSNIIDHSDLNYFQRVLKEAQFLKINYNNFRKLKLPSTKSQDTVDFCLFSKISNYSEDDKGQLYNKFIDPLGASLTGRKLTYYRGENKAKEFVVTETYAFDYFLLKNKISKGMTNFIRSVFMINESKSFSHKYVDAIDRIVDYLKSFKLLENFNFFKINEWFDKTLEHNKAAELLIKKIKPKCIILYSYYFPTQFGVVLAGNRNGIKTVDYQHGIQNAMHYGYGSWESVPRKGYQMLPKEFWVYSEREKRNLDESFLRTEVSVKVIGNIGLESWRKSNLGSQGVDWVEKIRERGYKIIMFTVSSYLLPKDHFFWRYLSLIRELKIYVLFRMHPGYKNLKNNLIENLNIINFNNYNIDKTTEEDLYKLIGVIDLHITQGSTVAEEALYFDKTTIVIEKQWELYFKSYFDEKSMYLSDSEHELNEQVNLILEK